MTLVVEDGTGLAAAESFLSVTEYRDYLAKWGVTLGDPDSDCEVQLRKGTRTLQGLFKHRWPGVRQFYRQALDWPRVSGEDVDGMPIPWSSVPQPIKDATAELAYRSRTETLSPDLKRGNRVKRIKIGPVEREYETGAPGVVTRPEIGHILGRLLVPANRWQNGRSVGWRGSVTGEAFE